MRGGWVGSGVWDKVLKKNVFFYTFPYMSWCGWWTQGLTALYIRIKKSWKSIQMLKEPCIHDCCNFIRFEILLPNPVIVNQKAFWERKNCRCVSNMDHQSILTFASLQTKQDHLEPNIFTEAEQRFSEARVEFSINLEGWNISVSKTSSFLW